MRLNNFLFGLGLLFLCGMIQIQGVSGQLNPPTPPVFNVSGIDWNLDGLTFKCAEQIVKLVADKDLARMRLYSGRSLGDTGHFWECDQLTGTQYCLITLDTSAIGKQCDMRFAQCNIGLCLPDNCSDEDISILIHQFVPGFNQTLPEGSIGFNPHCQVDTTMKGNPLSIVGTILFSLMILFVLACTFIEMCSSGTLRSLYARVTVQVPPPPTPRELPTRIPTTDSNSSDTEESIPSGRSIQQSRMEYSDPQVLVPGMVQLLHMNSESESTTPTRSEELISMANHPTDDLDDDLDDDEKIDFNHVDSQFSSSSGGYSPHNAKENEAEESLLFNHEGSQSSEEEEQEFHEPGLFDNLSDVFPPPVVNIAKCFSIPVNWGRLLNPIPGEFGSLNCLRVFSILWVIWGHTLFFWAQIGAWNLPYTYNHALKESWWAQAAMSGIFAVDSFFFLSGFLCSYFLYERLLQGKRMEWFLVYFHRVWRIIPVYSFVILFYVTLLPVLGDGPFWWKLSWLVGKSSKFCWANILFINNFYPTDPTAQCVGWGWFLAVDFQFFLVSPFLIWLQYKKPRIGWLVLGLWLLLDLTTSTTLATVKGYSPSIIRPQPNFFADFYQKPYTRASPYIVGLSCGYLYSYIRRNKPDFKIPSIALHLGYGVCFSMMATIVFGIYWVDSWNQVENSLYLGFSRFFWGLCIAFLNMTMFFGYGGLLRQFFFARVWEPLGKLTYGAYLSHPLFMYLFYYNQWGYLYFETRNMWYYYFSHALCAFAFAVVAYFLIEKPFMNLEPILIKSTIRLIFKLQKKPLPRHLQDEMN